MTARRLDRTWLSVGGIIGRGHGVGVDVARDARHEERLRRRAEWQRIPAVALSEPDAGSDLPAERDDTVLEGVTGRPLDEIRCPGSAQVHEPTASPATALG
jgi:alkylation response protein AidB-like acyl-CoA dehydrogenase